MYICTVIYIKTITLSEFAPNEIIRPSIIHGLGFLSAANSHAIFASPKNVFFFWVETIFGPTLFYAVTMCQNSILCDVSLDGIRINAAQMEPLRTWAFQEKKGNTSGAGDRGPWHARKNCC